MNINKKEFETLYALLLKETPQFADAIVWLQGDQYDRGHKALSLYKDGWSKRIIISGNNILIGDNQKVGENNISLDLMKDFLLKNGVEEKAIIIDDGAMNTKDQAEHILKMARNEKWSKLILIGSSYYQPRAFLTFLKQAKEISWNGEIINQSAIIAWDDKPAGRNETAKILFDQEFVKIEKYNKDLASITQGIEYLNQKLFELRKVTEEDSQLLFKWINDPDARANSKNSKMIAWDEHVAWLTNKLADSSVYMYILSDSSEDIGTVRFEKVDEGFLISYFIDKNFRGQGFGGLILAEGMKKINTIFDQPNFVAYTKQGNISSEKIFNKLDFIFEREEIIDNIKFNVYKK